MKQRRLVKRILAILSSITIILSMQVNASAATQYAWGPNTWTPYQGSFYASTTYVSVYNMKWNSSQVSIWELAQSGQFLTWLTTEYEIRPVNYTTQQIWVLGSESFSTNLPAAYCEFQPDDPEDIAVCSGWAAGYVAETSYYGRLYLSAASNAPTTPRYIFESEYGQTVPLFDDSLPLCYEQYVSRPGLTLPSTYFGTYYNW